MYRVNGILKTTHVNSMLADKSRAFMPFVEMYVTNDVVEWVIEWKLFNFCLFILVIIVKFDLVKFMKRFYLRDSDKLRIVAWIKLN